MNKKAAEDLRKALEMHDTVEVVQELKSGDPDRVSRATDRAKEMIRKDEEEKKRRESGSD